MSDTKGLKREETLAFEYELEAPPEQVWQTVSDPVLREKWLPRQDLADTEPVVTSPGKEIRYQMREHEPPFLESIVTFQVTPRSGGGTVLRIVHELWDRRLVLQPPRAANGNTPWLMRAA